MVSYKTKSKKNKSHRRRHRSHKRHYRGGEDPQPPTFSNMLNDMDNKLQQNPTASNIATADPMAINNDSAATAPPQEDININQPSSPSMNDSNNTMAAMDTTAATTETQPMPLLSQTTDDTTQQPSTIKDKLKNTWGKITGWFDKDVKLTTPDKNNSGCDCNNQNTNAAATTGGRRRKHKHRKTHRKHKHTKKHRRTTHHKRRRGGFKPFEDKMPFNNVAKVSNMNVAKPDGYIKPYNGK